MNRALITRKLNLIESINRIDGATNEVYLQLLSSFAISASTWFHDQTTTAASEGQAKTNRKIRKW